MEEMIETNDFEEEVVGFDIEGSVFDTEELPITLKSCLLLNRAYIESIEELKEYLISKMRENDCRQNDLKEKSDYESVKEMTVNTGYSHPNSLIPFMSPYFKDIKGLSAKSNEDVIQKRNNGQINDSFLASSKTWNMNDRQKFENTFRVYEMQRLQKNLRDSKERLTKVKPFDTQTIEQINEVSQKLEQIGSQELSQLEMPERWDQSIDWLRVSTGLDSDHTADDCELYWNNFLHPNVNKNDWTKEEDNQLESLVKKYGMHDWDKVSQMLGTGRLSWQCCSRYQMEMNRDLKRIGPLTKAEAENVEQVIQSCRVGDYIPWHQISYFIEGRSLPQIKHYWNKINVIKRGDVWNDEENKVLSAAVKKYGIHNWRKVAHFLPGRSNRQCRERYMMRMNVKDRKLGNWTPQEDKLILQLAKKHDYHWVKVEREFEGRNARQIASRYELLIKHKSNPKQITERSENSRFGTRNLYAKNRINERIRQIINRSKAKFEDLDQILRIGRAKLAKRLELELKGFNLSNKGRPKKSKSEENIDKKISEMFAVYDQKPSSKKAFARGTQDQCVFNTTKEIINEIITGIEAHSDSELSKSICFIISNIITSKDVKSNEDEESESHEKTISCLSPPPIFPPNRTTVRAMRTMLMETDHLSRKIAKSKIGLQEYSAAVPEDEKYIKLCSQFKSLFCWPALLSLIDTPERNTQIKRVIDKSVVKSKRKSWLTSDTSRMIEIRTNQTKLIQTAMKSNEDTEVEEPVEEKMDESSTCAPWYLTPKERRNYRLKSLDKNSFVFTRVKPRYDAIPESDESLATKRKCDSNEETGNTCKEPVIENPVRNKKSKNNKEESDSTGAQVKDVSKNSKFVKKKQKLNKEPKDENSLNRLGNRSSSRIRAINARAV